MGTEIYLIVVIHLSNSFHRVKLNNPLMGTEIFTNDVKIVVIVKIHVKLNNPLMGTEITDIFCQEFL